MSTIYSPGTLTDVVPLADVSKSYTRIEERVADIEDAVRRDSPLKYWRAVVALKRSLAEERRRAREAAGK